MCSKRTAATYITWDGPDQNYLESLFLPIFGRVAKEGVDFSVLQFTWGEGLRRNSTALAAARLGIAYEPCKIFRRPLLRPATLAMIFVGAARIVAHSRAHGTEVLIPRSIIPAAMTLLAHRHLPDIRVVYDSDGFVADERVEFSGWRARGMTYRTFRRVEVEICRIADSAMTRSTKGAHILKHRIGDELTDLDIYVVPNGKEATLFSPGSEASRRDVRKELGLDENAPLVLYAGSLDERYMPEQIFQFYAQIQWRRSDSHLLVLTGNQDVARQAANAAGICSDSLTIQRVLPEEVPRYLAAADIGISLRKDTFSQQCVSPIKLAEYLLCGLPVIVTTDVGDVDRQLTEADGIILPDFSHRGLVEAADDFVERILPRRESFRQQCRQTGLQHFSLDNAAQGYWDAIDGAREKSDLALANAHRRDAREDRSPVLRSSTLP